MHTDTGPMTPEKLAEETNIINAMDRYEMCRMWRFSAAGSCKYFDTTTPLWPIWEKRFKELGGFSPEISKSLGWD